MRVVPRLPSVRLAAPLLVTALTVIVGLVLALQLFHTNRRVIEATMALLLVVLSLRYPLFWSVAAFTIVMLFPLGLSVGNTNMILVFFMLCVWAFRIAMGQYRPRFKTGLDAPILLLVAAYLLSFFSVSNVHYLTGGLGNLGIMLGCIMFFYLVVNFVRSDQGLETVVQFMCVGAFLVMLTTVYQAAFPGRTLIPGWILAEADPTLSASAHGIRLGGAFYSHDVLADYSVAILFLAWLMFMRARSMTRRVFYAGLMALTLFAILATANRGGVLALPVGIFYLGWLARRDLRIVPAAVTLLLGAVTMWILTIVLADYTNVASMFERISETKFQGLTPDTRVGVWSQAYNRALERPIFGHGPYYDIHLGSPEHIFWPHNAFVWAFYITGIVGVIAFAWVILAMLRHSWRFAGRSLKEASFARGLVMVLHVEVVLFLFAQLRTDYQRTPTYMFFTWLLFGLIAACALVIREGEQAAEATAAMPVRRVTLRPPLQASARARPAAPARPAVAPARPAAGGPLTRMRAAAERRRKTGA